MSVGTGLAQARRDAGLTLEQVSDATRLRRSMLEDLENDDFSACGGDVYARGHIKSYCRVVGIDPAPLLAEFDAERGPANITAPTMTAAFETERRGVEAQPRTGPNWSAAMAVALAVVVVIGGIGLVTRGSGSGSVPAVAGSATSTPSTSAPTTPAPSPSPTVLAQRPVTGVVAKVTITGSSSWVSATNGKNGKVFYEGILQRGETKTFRDKKKVRLVLGNAGAVSLTVNGRDLGSPGGSGDVVRVEFGPGDPTGSTG